MNSHWNTFDSRELGDFLGIRGFSSSLIDQRKVDLIDGEYLLHMNAEEQDRLGFKTGEKIRRFLGELDSTFHKTRRSCTVAVDVTVIEKEQHLHSQNCAENSVASTSNSQLSGGSNDVGIRHSPAPTFVKEATNGKVYFDIMAILSKDPAGQKLYEKYQEFQDRQALLITDEERNSLVRICTDSLTEQIGNNYPSTDQKRQLAIALCECFPGFKVDLPNCSYYCHLHNATSSGFIDTRLKTLRNPDLKTKRPASDIGEHPAVNRKSKKGMKLKRILKLTKRWWFG